MTNSVIRQGLQVPDGFPIRLETLRHGDALPPRAQALVRAGQAEGHGFLDQVPAFWGRPGSQYDDPRACILLAWRGPEVVGVAGLAIDTYACDGTTGRLKHVYVAPGARRRGVAEALVRRAMAEAAGGWRRLRLRAADPGAARLYERLGFRAAPAEPDATHMLELPPDPRPSAPDGPGRP